MRSKLPRWVDNYRIQGDNYASPDGALWGAFQFAALRVLSSGESRQDCLPLTAWEHASVSRTDRTPNWGEMASVKHLFWDDEEVVLQFHLPSSQYVNHNPFCLHLWKPPYKVEMPADGCGLSGEALYAALRGEEE